LLSSWPSFLDKRTSNESSDIWVEKKYADLCVLTANRPFSTISIPEGQSSVNAPCQGAIDALVDPWSVATSAGAGVIADLRQPLPAGWDHLPMDQDEPEKLSKPDSKHA
jgi:hypothetical protein